MNKSPWSYIAVVCALFAVLSTAGCGTKDAVSSEAQTDVATESKASGEHFLPGAALSPIANRDWYELVAVDASESISFAQLQREIEFSPVVLAGQDGKLLMPNKITRVAQTLGDGTIVMGYTLRYDGRIALAITPTDLPMDALAESAARTIDPDVNGIDHPWHVTSVRGTKGLARNATVQKWKSGDKMEAPSAIDWQEKADGSAPYTRYLLLGDVPVGQLRSLTSKMQRL